MDHGYASLSLWQPGCLRKNSQIVSGLGGNNETLDFMWQRRVFPWGRREPFSQPGFFSNIFAIIIARLQVLRQAEMIRHCPCVCLSIFAWVSISCHRLSGSEPVAIEGEGFYLVRPIDKSSVWLSCVARPSASQTTLQNRAIKS